MISKTMSSRCLETGVVADVVVVGRGMFLLVVVTVDHGGFLLRVNAVEVRFRKLVNYPAANRVALYVHSGANTVPGRREIVDLKHLSCFFLFLISLSALNAAFF